MSQYDIRVKIDPSGVGPGRAKVEQELRGLENTAGSTTKSIERMTAAEFRAAGGMDGLAKSSANAAASQRGMEQALDRVLRSVDEEAAGLRRLNSLLTDAKRLHDAGKISAEQYAKVQKLVAAGSNGVTTSLGQQRAGYTQLGFQVQDITQQMALGVNPMVVLAQQAGQTASAISLAVGDKGALGRAATFIAGPWGSIIVAATAILGTFAFKWLASRDAIDEAVEALKKDAAESKVAAEAKEIFARSIEGVRAAAFEQNEALKESAKSTRQAELDALKLADANLTLEINTRKATQAMLEQAIAQYELLKQQEEAATKRNTTTGSLAGREAGDVLGMAAGITQDRINSLTALLEKSGAAVTKAEEGLRRARAPIIQREVAEATNATTKATADYERASERLYNQMVAGKITQDAYRAGLLAETDKRDKAIEKIREQERAERKLQRTQSDGVALFTSRRQAIGIAGRELQGQGLDVSGNNQFRYTSGHANDADHNRNAIDVNVSSAPGRSTGGIVEANVPDLRARFDALALLYQKRGYNVLWNGQKYLAFGNGPSGPAAGHKDHIHLYAPETIVGKPTLASTASQELQGIKAEATIAEQKRDFVSGVVNTAAGRGLPDNRATQLTAKIDANLAEYQRRFNEAPSPEERSAIVGALTDADAREQAEAFRKAYVEPLAAMEAALGKTGVERQVYNAILDETAKKGAALTPAETAMIENGVRRTEQLKLEQSILEQIAQPMENYRATIAALNDLLAKGAIGQSEYNARVAELRTTVTNGLSGLPGVDPTTGQSYDDIAKEAEEQARYAREIANFESQKQQLLQLGISYDALIEAAHRRHVNNLNNIDLARKQLAISAYSNIANSLVSIAENAAGRQSAVYKAMFAVSKAFAIADSIVQIQAALAKALNAPFPQNLVQFGIVAAQAASIVSNIQSVAANFADGGMVRGPGGPRDDAVPANLSAGEYVVNATAVARPGNRALLEAINSGAATTGLRRATADRSAAGSTPGGDNISLSFGDVVVQTGAGTTAEDGEEIGQSVRQALSELVDERIATLQRPGGRLTRTRPSVLG